MGFKKLWKEYYSYFRYLAIPTDNSGIYYWRYYFVFYGIVKKDWKLEDRSAMLLTSVF